MQGRLLEMIPSGVYDVTEQNTYRANMHIQSIVDHKMDDSK